jgi:zona occludens toxin (predicted ATPase)
MRTLLLCLPVCLLTACGGSISGSPAVAPCAAPVDLPERALSDRDVEVLWGRDRSALRECGALLAARY